MYVQLCSYQTEIGTLQFMDSASYTSVRPEQEDHAGTAICHTTYHDFGTHVLAG